MHHKERTLTWKLEKSLEVLYHNKLTTTMLQTFLTWMLESGFTSWIKRLCSLICTPVTWQALCSVGPLFVGEGCDPSQFRSQGGVVIDKCMFRAYISVTCMRGEEMIIKTNTLESLYSLSLSEKAEVLCLGIQIKWTVTGLQHMSSELCIQRK